MAAAVKKFRQMIEGYQGPPEGLKAYPLRCLSKMNPAQANSVRI